MALIIEMKELSNRLGYKARKEMRYFTKLSPCNAGVTKTA